MLDTIERTPAELPLVEQPMKRELIEDALRTDPKRSDREIARVVGCDHKTVGAARGRLGIAAAPKPSQGVTRRHGVTLAPALFPILNSPKPEKFNPFDPNGESLLIPERLGLAVFINTRDNVVICNGNVRDGIDDMVQINPDDLPILIRQLGEILSEIQDAEREDGSHG